MTEFERTRRLRRVQFVLCLAFVALLGFGVILLEAQ